MSVHISRIEMKKFNCLHELGSQHRRAGENLLKVVKARLLSLNRLLASTNEVNQFSFELVRSLSTPNFLFRPVKEPACS